MQVMKPGENFSNSRQALFEKFPNLLNQRGRLCINVHQNFGGSLFIQDWSEQHRDELRGVPDTEIRDKLLNSVILIDNVPIYFFDKHSGENSPVEIDNKPLVADRVLIKNICGKTAGLILSGPARGLLLEIFGYYSDEESTKRTQLQAGMNAGYFVQHRRLRKIDYPYMHRINKWRYSSQLLNQETINLLNELNSDLGIWWNSFIRLMKKDATTTNLIIGLLNELGIDHEFEPVDFL